MKKAGVAIFIKNGFILGISRRNDASKFGLIGGKVSENETILEAVIREAKEEANITINKCFFLYSREEFSSSEDSENFQSDCYFVYDWVGNIKPEDGLQLEWMTWKELSEGSSAAFPEFNSQAFKVLKEKFPKIHLEE